MSEITGSDQAERLDGSVGDDTIWGYAGNDTIAGSAGNDRIITGDGVDVVDGGAGNDEINGFMIDASSGQYSTYGSTGIKTIDGGEGNDVIFGGSDADRLNGGAGNDQIYGDAGADVINGGDGADSLYGQDGNDQIDGGDGNDQITGGKGADSLVGGAGDDFLYDQESGADTLLGGAGNDKLNAYTGTGNKYLDGGDGNDTLSAGNGSDTLMGGAGNDELNAYESSGNISLDGGSGNDTLLGGPGNDTLKGGLGIDDLEGGAGNDVYYVSDLTDYIYDTGGADTAYVSQSFVKLPSAIETVIYTNGALALPYWISALMFDSGAGLNDATLLGSAKTFKYAFPSALPTYYNGTSQADGSFVGFSDTQKIRAVTALNYIETVIDVKFVLASETNALNTLSFGTNAQTGSAGYAFGPSTRPDGNDVFLDKNDIHVKDLADGTYGAQILIHEIGHALGLKHPFSGADAAKGNAEPPYLTGPEDATIWTVMSYTNQPIEQTQLKYSPLDIAALQYIYGPSTTARTGSDTYTISESEANFIWDGGGTDKISAVSSSKAVTIYLEPGFWGYAGTAKADAISTAGQITVNFGTQIENLDGSGWGDSLYGNALSNVINGNAGNDTVQAFAGNDTIDGGDGQDTVTYALSASQYTVTSVSSGGYQVLAKSGEEGTDTLRNVEFLKFADQTASLANFVTSGSGTTASAKYWKDNTKTPSDSGKTNAVNLTDAIAILKMIVGLNVNSNNTALSPYQAIAADFDQSGDVGLTDAIGVLKMVVGLTAPSPTWKYYDETKLTSVYSATQSLNPKAWTSTAVVSETDTVASSVKLVGVLTGDVDGSWTGV